jgi:hypothetical protein
MPHGRGQVAYYELALTQHGTITGLRAASSVKRAPKPVGCQNSAWCLTNGFKPLPRSAHRSRHRGRTRSPSASSARCAGNALTTSWSPGPATSQQWCANTSTTTTRSGRTDRWNNAHPQAAPDTFRGSHPRAPTRPARRPPTRVPPGRMTYQSSRAPTRTRRDVFPTGLCCSDSWDRCGQHRRSHRMLRRQPAPGVAGQRASSAGEVS